MQACLAARSHVRPIGACVRCTLAVFIPVSAVELTAHECACRREQTYACLQAIAGPGDEPAQQENAQALVTTGTGGASGAACRHVVTKTAAELAFGMCSECYTAYIRASGGIVAGAADPPAFTRNLRRCAFCVHLRFLHASLHTCLTAVWRRTTACVRFAHSLSSSLLPFVT